MKDDALYFLRFLIIISVMDFGNNTGTIDFIVFEGQCILVCIEQVIKCLQIEQKFISNQAKVAMVT